eukprot:12597532-Heterocapsa_arctica.AAC.1
MTKRRTKQARKEGKVAGRAQAAVRNNPGIGNPGTKTSPLRRKPIRGESKRRNQIRGRRRRIILKRCSPDGWSSFR